MYLHLCDPSLAVPPGAILLCFRTVVGHREINLPLIFHCQQCAGPKAMILHQAKQDGLRGISTVAVAYSGRLVLGAASASPDPDATLPSASPEALSASWKLRSESLLDQGFTGLCRASASSAERTVVSHSKDLTTNQTQQQMEYQRHWPATPETDSQQ